MKENTRNNILFKNVKFHHTFFRHIATSSPVPVKNRSSQRWNKTNGQKSRGNPTIILQHSSPRQMKKSHMFITQFVITKIASQSEVQNQISLRTTNTLLTYIQTSTFRSSLSRHSDGFVIVMLIWERWKVKNSGLQSSLWIFLNTNIGKIIFSRRCQQVSEVQAVLFLAWKMLLLHNHRICIEVNFSSNHYNKTKTKPVTSTLDQDMCYISQCMFWEKNRAVIKCAAKELLRK